VTAPAHRLAALLRARQGLALSPASTPRLERLMRERAAARGLDVAAYVRQLEETPDEGELRFLALGLAVTEGWLFRGLAQLEALAKLLPPLAALTPGGPGAPVRLLSAGCGRGEEAYTLSALCDHALPPSATVEIVGADWSEAALAVAREGRFPPPPSGEVPAWGRGLWVGSGRHLEVSPRHRARIGFVRADLLDAGEVRGLGRFALVLCRNVLLYFEASRRAQLLATLGERLWPGGLLVLAPTEAAPSEVVGLEPFGEAGGPAFRRPC
jgi:chemotaxis protein methyltransferase CheR